MATRAPEAPEPMTEVVDADWSRDDLTGRVHTATKFVRVDLAEAESSGGTVFDGCAFRDCLFNLATLTGTAFVNCSFSGCNFFAATLTDCKLVGSTFSHCDFAQLTVDGGDWSFATLRGADLRTAKVRHVRLREAGLAGINATGGVLRDCDLGSADLHEAQLVRCDLRGSDLSSLDPANVDLRGAVINFEQAVVIAAALGMDVQP